MNDYLSRDEVEELILSVAAETKFSTTRVSILGEGDFMKLICKLAPVIIFALQFAKFLFGKKVKEAIEAFIEILKASCQLTPQKWFGVPFFYCNAKHVFYIELKFLKDMLFSKWEKKYL